MQYSTKQYHGDANIKSRLRGSIEQTFTFSITKTKRKKQEKQVGGEAVDQRFSTGVWQEFLKHTIPD